MIDSSWPIVTPVSNIVFCCFVLLDLKSGDVTYIRTDNMCEYNDPYRRYFGLAEWINKIFFMLYVTNMYRILDRKQEVKVQKITILRYDICIKIIYNDCEKLQQLIYFCIHEQSLVKYCPYRK